MDIKSDWANRLIIDSKQLTTTTFLAGVMPGHIDVLNSVASMFTRFSADELPNVRAWVDGGQRYTITDALIALSPQINLALDTRLAQATASPQYCVTFNGLSSWCQHFALNMQATMLTPLFEALKGAPRCGVDFYAFFGNYGYTPFGVHDDLDQSLLWHLGPAPKTAYVWPRQLYRELTGGLLATTNYESLLPHAQRFDLAPGDLLFIPQGDFHILDTREFSATLGLTLFPDDSLLECSSGLRLLLPNEQALSTRASTPVTLNELVELRRLALQSNGFVITPPQRSTLPQISTDFATLHRSMICSYRCWPLRQLQLVEHSALLVRHRIIWGRSSTLFAELCELFSKNQPIPYKELEHHFANRVQATAIAELICNIAKLGGLSIEQK
ncbi:hypothetical protein HZU77_001400 [Neisseriaceae bacterium TC5R-5]|nr:hypothetical protein [Neisseriaceae bacterium TC5R-5]